MSVLGLCGVAEQFYEVLIASANLGIKTEKKLTSLNNFQIYHLKKRFISLSTFIITVINEIKCSMVILRVIQFSTCQIQQSTDIKIKKIK